MMNHLKLNLVQDGVTKLPPGFRFQPTDEELVFQYLKCKVFSLPLPASIIPDINLCNYDPWDLPGELAEKRYFFSSKEAKYKTGNRINRATASGYWKATGLDKKITSRTTTMRNQICGMRKTLVFHTGKPPHGTRTDWIMHEYRLVTVTNNSRNPKIQNYLNHHMDKWVLCHLFLKKISRIDVKDGEIIQSFRSDNQVSKTMSVDHLQRPKFFYFMGGEENINNHYPAMTCSSSSSSSSSSITEASSSVNGADHDQESSS